MPIDMKSYLGLGAAVVWLVVLLAVDVQSAILRVGNPLSWPAARPYLLSVRTDGYKQFLSHYKRSQDIETPLFLWGDELEYGLLQFDRANNRYDLYKNSAKIRENLLKLEASLRGDLPIGCEWHPEYGSWMIEATPHSPYGSYLADLLNVQKSMSLRRKRLLYALGEDIIAPSMSNFPMLGVEGYSHRSSGTQGEIANSLYIPDDLINPHPRFGALTRNIRLRKRSNVLVTAPTDPSEREKIECTDQELGDICRAYCTTNDDECNNRHKEALIEEKLGNLVHMDAMAFGMGCCCLQVTMQFKSEIESRYIHDQLAIFSPLMLALSAATPIFKGSLVGTDCRWDVISQSVDDRTPAEDGKASPEELEDKLYEDPLIAGSGVKRLEKSRYSSNSLFIGKPRSEEELDNIESLNDLPVDRDETAYEYLCSQGLDPMLSSHIAHMFIRDPLVIFDDAIELDNEKSMDHFENIQSTNWRTMRWKPPSLKLGLDNVENKERNKQVKENPVDALGNEAQTADLSSAGPGWRVEFRPLEIQLTDFENAAYSIFIVLLSRCILSMGYDFYMPISLVEENMRRAHEKDAVKQEKFWIRTNFGWKGSSDVDEICGRKDVKNKLDSEFKIPRMQDIIVDELTLGEILNGKQDAVFPGLITVLLEYLQFMGCERTSKCFRDLLPYLELLGQRAAGNLPTAASWMRNFVTSHPDYKNQVDGAGKGKLNSKIADDLVKMCNEIGTGRRKCPELYGSAAKIVNLDLIDEEDLLYSNHMAYPTTDPDLMPEDLMRTVKEIRQEKAATQAAISTANRENDTVDGGAISFVDEEISEDVIQMSKDVDLKEEMNEVTRMQ